MSKKHRNAGPDRGHESGQAGEIVHTDGIKIEAGCFGGSLDEFCEKAGREGKTRYVRVVRAAAEALQADVIDKGITGGWDEEKSK